MPIRKYFPKVGDRFGKWTVVDPEVKKGNALCKCDCGTVNTVGRHELYTGLSKGCVHCGQRFRKGHHMKPFKHIPSTYLAVVKANAKDRNLEFNLTLEYLDNLLERQDFTCALSGVKLYAPKLLKSYTGYNALDRKSFTMSLDRVDSTKGYLEGNVQWVHKHVNVMKGAMTDLAFISICKLVADHNSSAELLHIDEIYKASNFGHKIR